MLFYKGASQEMVQQNTILSRLETHRHVCLSDKKKPNMAKAAKTYLISHREMINTSSFTYMDGISMVIRSFLQGCRCNMKMLSLKNKSHAQRISIHHCDPIRQAISWASCSSRPEGEYVQPLALGYGNGQRLYERRGNQRFTFKKPTNP